MLSRICFFFFISLLFSVSISAQNTSAITSGIKGTVKDAADNEPVLGAHIYDVADKTHGTAADINGNYQLKLNSGKHSIICASVGLKSDTITVQIDSLKIAEHHFVLNSLSTQLQTMVVSAGKYERKLEEITVSMEVVKPTLIENKNAANVKGVLEQVPGLNILDGEPQIRGGSGFNFGIGSRVAILIDGLPALAGDGGKPEWNFIPLENVEQIEVIKGASSVTYGSSALSGSINVRTAYPKSEPLTKVALSSGLYDAPSVANAKWWTGVSNFSNVSFLHSRQIGQLDLVIGGMAIYDHGFIGPPRYHPRLAAFNDTSIKNNEVGEKTGRINFNLRYRPKNIPRLNFGVNGNFMRSSNNLSLIWDGDSSGVPTYSANSGLYRAFPHTMTLQEQTMLYLDPFINYYSSKEFKHSIRTRYFYTKNDLPDQTNETNVAYSEYQLTKAINKNLNITGGTIMNQIFSNSGLPFKGIKPSHHLKNYAFYAQLDKNLWKILNLSLGFRNEFFKMNDQEMVSKPIFRSGLNLKLSQATFVRGSFGQGYRFPTITEKYMYSNIGGMAIFPNPLLRPETSWNSEIGFKQGFKVHQFTGFLDVAFFWQEYKNTIEFTYGAWDKQKDMFGDDSLAIGFKYLNTGQTRVKGFELSLPGEGKISKNLKLNVLLGYTYVLPQAVHPNEGFAVDSTQKTMSYSNTSTDTTNHVLKYRFQHIAKIDLQVTYKSFFMGGSCRYYSFVQNIDTIFYTLESKMRSGIERYRKENNKGTFVSDIRIGMNISRNCKLAFVINNLFNKSYSLRPLKIESSRTFALRLSMNIGE